MSTSPVIDARAWLQAVAFDRLTAAERAELIASVTTHKELGDLFAALSDKLVGPVRGVEA